MNAFTYDPSTLTDAQREAIAAATKATEEYIKELQAEEERRAQHYYDCVDEYSYGGICSTLNARQQARAKYDLAETIETIVNGYITKTRRVNILRDIATGEVAADGVRSGEYGPYFKTYDAFGGKFISFAKRVSTYEKKGFRPYVQTVVEKVIRVGRWSNGEPRYKHIDYISITEEVSTERVY